MAVTHDEVRQIFGDISDHKVVEIIDSGATPAELTEVAAHLAQETDVMGELERPLTGRALAIYNLLRQDEEYWEQDR
ncbi:hypothetical protein [Actibacterium sp. MT2.3-13A]|uniref:hypothetical protein n=1 Tax=Actibacterium sp. MT2.3-13A TaxID=2828332 RepID=UPI001BA5F64C|nr:hypothetical protein [Actibacterium sp. MT2.3-13A]